MAENNKLVKLTIHDQLTQSAIARLTQNNRKSAFICAALHQYVASADGKKLLEMYAPQKM